MPLKNLLRRIPGLPQAFRWAKRQRALARFRREFAQFKELSVANDRGFALRWADRYPCLDDNTADTGFDRHYVFHQAWAARVLAETRPTEHTDIASSLYFATMMSAFVPIRFYDFRPADMQLSGLRSEAADLTQLAFPDNSVASLSCMHVLEHIGLGRYGDPIDPDGYWKAMQELKRVLAPKGNFLLVVPVGKPKIMFNAHRIFSYEQVLTAMSGLTLHQFALIPDDAQQGGLLIGADPRLVREQDYGCGCFWFQK